MILEDLALNIAAGLVQWLIEPKLDDWRRRRHDPQRAAVTKVFETAARQMLRGLSADLQQSRPDLGPGDYTALGSVLEDYFALPQVRTALLDAAVTGQLLDMARMETHFRTVHGPARTPGIPFPLARSLTVFCEHLGARIRTAAQDKDSPLHNFWSMLVADNTQRIARAIEGAVQDNQSGIDEIRRLLAQTLTTVSPGYSGSTSRRHPPPRSSGATLSSPTWSPISPPAIARPSPRMGCPAWARPHWPWPWRMIRLCGRISRAACSGPARAPSPT